MISDHVRCLRCNGEGHIPRQHLREGEKTEATKDAPEVPCPECHGDGWHRTRGGRGGATVVSVGSGTGK